MSIAICLVVRSSHIRMVKKSKTQVVLERLSCYFDTHFSFLRMILTITQRNPSCCPQRSFSHLNALARPFVAVVVIFPFLNQKIEKQTHSVIWKDFVSCMYYETVWTCPLSIFYDSFWASSRSRSSSCS